MDPVAFTVFGWSVRWYGVFIALALLIGILIATRLAKKRGLNEDHVWTVLLVTVPCAIIGARLYYVIFQWEHYRFDLGEIVAIWHGGLAIHGAILGGILAVFLVCRYYRMSFGSIADCFAPALALGQAIGRWGNFINGEAHGYATNLPWAIEVNGEMVHPTFLYESLWDLMVFFVTLFLFQRAKRNGNVFLWYLMLYSIGRFIVEGFRTDSLMIGPLRQAQGISIVLFVVALVIYLWGLWKQKGNSFNTPAPNRKKNTAKKNKR